MKIKTTKIPSKELTSNSTKICTSKNFPLYGIYTMCDMLRSSTAVTAVCIGYCLPAQTVRHSVMPYVRVKKNCALRL